MHKFGFSMYKVLAVVICLFIAGAVAIAQQAVNVVGNSVGVATAANQTTELGYLATIATNSGGSIPAGTAVIGVTGAPTATIPPSVATYIGANASGGTGGLLAGMIQCDSTAIYDASTSGSTELKALTSGRSIYICGYSIIAGGTVNVKLIYGTGTACATGSNNMTPAFQLTAQAGLVDGSPFYRGLKTASANALCINTSAGIAVQAIVYYSVI